MQTEKHPRTTSDQGSLGAGLEPEPTLEPVLCFSNSQRTGSWPGKLVQEGHPNLLALIVPPEVDQSRSETVPPLHICNFQTDGDVEN